MLAMLLLMTCPVAAKPLSECTVWTLNEGCWNQQAAELAASVPSDLLMRAWFKWQQARDYAAERAVIPVAKAGGALFGGGTTVSALYRGENGVSPEQWRRMATRDPFGHIIPAWTDRNIAHGAIAGEEYLDYALKWCYGQIDAGVDSLFMDEVQGAYSQFEGFDDPAMSKFAAWLSRKYCDGQGWNPDDPRWRQKLSLDTSDREVCPDGTIRSFNYRAWLLKRDLAADPYAQDNPLRGEWSGSADSFYEWRADWAWKYLCDHIRAHAAQVGREVSINANGLNKYVDFQVAGFWIEWAGERRRVTTSASYLKKYRSTVLQGCELAGKQVPVVFFHDWGFDGFPFSELTSADRIKWFKVYAPEVYAAGGFFCWPVNIAHAEDLAVIKRYTAWYQAHRAWFHGGEWLTTRRLMASASKLSLALWELPTLNRRVLHLINHNGDRELAPLEQVELRIPSGARPARVVWASPEIGPDRPLEFTFADSRVTVRVPRLEGYAALALEYDRLPAGDMDLVGGAEVEIPVAGGWRRPLVNHFVVGANGKINGPGELLYTVQGDLHPDLRNNPTFVVDYPGDGQFTVHVNSVAALGAVIEIYVDGKLALRQELPDLDRANDGNAHEYDQDFSVPVPGGKHEIRVDNTGGDWFSVDYYLLTNYRARP